MNSKQLKVNGILASAVLAFTVGGSVAAVAGESVAAQNIQAIYQAQIQATDSATAPAADFATGNVAEQKILDLRDPVRAARSDAPASAERVATGKASGDVAAENIRAIYTTSYAG